MKVPTSPLLGFNNNIRHKGRVFHVQTEDSGIKHPHVITHLFADGGRILKTTKTSYAEHVGTEAIQQTVRLLMQEQHKAMIIALRDGQFDHLIDDGRSRAASSPDIPPSARRAPLPSVPDGPSSTPALSTPAAPSAMSAAPSAMSAMSATSEATRPAEPPAARPRTLTFESPAAPSPQASAPQAEPRPRTPTLPPPAPRMADVDREVLERAAAESQGPAFRPASDLPPPPAAVFQKRAGSSVPTGYRSVTPSPGAVASPPPAAPPRYAPSRPAAIFSSTGRPSEGTSIFGEDLISEKSLDEVILSYLAEDLEPEGEGGKR